jgi:hypothetical protein
MTAGLYATIIIAASDFEAPPAVDTSMLERMPDSFSFTVDALQGALLELETSINGLDSWVPAAEALSEDGEVHFSPSLSRTNSSGFFRIKVK